METSYNPYMRNAYSVNSPLSKLDVPQFALDAYNRGEISADKIHDAIFKQLGASPEDVEAAIMILVIVNSTIVDQFNNLLDALFASTTEEGRDKHAYEKNYLTKNKQGHCVLKSILCKSRKIITEYDAKIYELSTKYVEEKDFEYRMADAIDEADNILSVMRKAMERYFYTQLSKETIKPYDMWATIDVLTTFAIADIARKTYLYLTSNNAFPFINAIDSYKFLNGMAFVNQVQKIIENIPLVDENGNEFEFNFKRVFYSNEMKTLFDDFHKVLMSIEFVARIFKVRNNASVKASNGVKSYVRGWNDSTYSLNYYTLHYASAYPLDKIKRKNKKC